ncbi:hypothetical protein QYF61_016925 [Mycteria americana]|uniref:SH3 domain-containing protein n=1 Tax=Mycteria americana TaxID=33587 RepID=A0AAN7NHD6_MYCAM|nr:hypothetical protein QYF61_016925 [Mycteria americana]
MEMMNKNIRLAEKNSRLCGQMHWTENVQAENSDVKRKLTRVAEERNSAIQGTGCLQTQLEDAEHKLKTTREMSERRQQLEKEHKETKVTLQRKEKEDEFFCQSSQTEIKREHKAMQLFQAQVNNNWDNNYRTFIARYNYNPFDGPCEQPELELPLTAGQCVYVFGEVDEAGWYVGELADGTRGFIPSNFVEVLDDNLENKNWNDSHYDIFGLLPILEEDEEDLDLGVRR